jgi:hypothetical protein
MIQLPHYNSGCIMSCTTILSGIEIVISPLYFIKTNIKLFIGIPSYERLDKYSLGADHFRFPVSGF